jgi:rare lipoprotein A
LARGTSSLWQDQRVTASTRRDRMLTDNRVSRRIAMAETNLCAARILRLVTVTGVALVAANCSQQKFGGGGIDPKYGVKASPRVVAEGDPVPKGGGRNQVGQPYVVAGRTYVPQENPTKVSVGLASWYGSNFHGRMTANGEIFDRNSIAAAHTTMPLPSYARVTNVQNGRSIIVRVNDRGPFHDNRVIDVSQRTAEALDFMRSGTARVRVEYVGRAGLNGSDDRMLLASLRTDGSPATLQSSSVMVAQATPRPEIPRAALAFQPLPVRQAPAAATPASIASRTSVPLPPERPFDLGTIRSAATPAPAIRPLAEMTTRRAAFAGLY